MKERSRTIPIPPLHPNLTPLSRLRGQGWGVGANYPALIDFARRRVLHLPCDTPPTDSPYGPFD